MWLYCCFCGIHYIFLLFYSKQCLMKYDFAACDCTHIFIVSWFYSLGEIMKWNCPIIMYPKHAPAIRDQIYLHSFKMTFGRVWQTMFCIYLCIVLKLPSFVTRGQFWPSGIVVASVCLSVCLCVRQWLACPRDNLSPVQATITKFGPEEQKTLVKIPIVLGVNWPWTSRSNLT